jgi:putative SOS response-associated peptidase YedK
MKSGKPFAFAGLWDSWNSPDGSTVLSCTIITTGPNTLMQNIHNRMPVILPASYYHQWLEAGEADTNKLEALLQPYPADEMTAYPVSMLVNSLANDLAACIKPVDL